MSDRTLDEVFDTQMEVERNPCGAWWAIKSQAAEITRLQARLADAGKLAEAMADTADMSLTGEIPDDMFEDDAPDFNRGYDAAIRKVRAALSTFQEGGK